MPNGPQMVDGVTFPQGHEGISGQTIAQIAARVPTPALTDMPHIVLIHAGTNDTYGTDPAGAPARLEALVDKLIMAAPDALLVVATIVPYNPQAANIALINDSVQPLVTARAAAGAHVIMVDQFAAFPSNGMSSDGVHPNQTGYEQMGQVWYEAIEEYLR